ncbi:DUF3341 domain-containing protein [candidate division KSB1 bacterium]
MSASNIISIFDEEHSLIAALDKIKNKGIRIKEIFTPYPVHEAIQAMGKKSLFTFFAFLYGFIGAAAVLSFLYYAAVIDWPLNYGGKPTSAFPSFIVITIVLTIFTITILSLFTFSIRAKIFPGKKFKLYDERATDDKFIVVIDKNDIKDDLQDFNNMMREEGAIEIIEKGEPEKRLF